MKNPSNQTGDQNAMSHLRELRKRLIAVLIFFLVCFFASFVFVPRIMDFIRMTSGSVVMDLNLFNVSDSIYLYMKIASLGAFVFTMPYILFQIWRFIKPGLIKSEIKYVRRLLPIVFVLFISGILFSYFVIIPYYIGFSTALAKTNELVPVIGAKMYIDFIVKTVWPFGLVFELPMLVHVFSRVGIINYRLLKGIRGYAYIGLMIVSAFLTPPDPVSMGIMLVPLSLLYESSIWIARRNHRKYHLKNIREEVDCSVS